jgi:tRNA dimethylallyltransferase
MQMYDGLPIITNKITVEEQKGIPHHLLGFIALDEEPWVVGMFKKKASKIIKEIRSRGRLPIVVGGTHYYTQSLLFEDSLVAGILNKQEAQNTSSDQKSSERFPILDGPTGMMIERLKEVDPIMAERWHPNDRRRIRRSLEIFLLSGKRASDIYAEQKAARSLRAHNPMVKGESCQPLSDTLLFWVHSDPEILKDRLDNRVNTMLQAGLLSEVKSLNDYLRKQAESGFVVDRERGIWASIGWKEFEEYLLALEKSDESKEKLAELYDLCVEKIKAATRRYANRQTRWVRLKLMPSLLERNALARLYLLDGSDIALWLEKVSGPAMEVTQNFLAGDELCPPHEMSPVAKRVLAPRESGTAGVMPLGQECGVCNIACIGEDAWQAHLKGRRHRALVKKGQRISYGMSSLPRDERNSDPPKTP